MRLLTLAAAVLLAACGTGCEYQYEASVECTIGNTCTTTTGVGCTTDDALVAARNACSGTPGRTISEDSYLVVVGACDPNRQAEALQPIAETSTLFRNGCQRLTNGGQAAAVDAPNCGGGGIAYTVVFHNERQNGMACAGVPRLVRVGYYRYSPTPPNEYVELEGSVDFGGTHTIAVPDAKPSGSNPSEAGLVKAELQVLQVDGNSCFGIPLDDESYGPVISEGIVEGSTVHVTLNSEGFVEISISGPSSAVGEGTAPKGLQPIPDPMFAVK